jgi:hypothetical protein
VRSVVAVLALVPNVAFAGLIPGPREEGYDPELERKADAFDRQLHELITVPLGFGLEAYVGDPANRAAIEAFFVSGATSVRQHSGKHPYELIDEYEEFGDLGMFGGVQAAGDAFRYAVLRDQAADPDRVGRARDNLLRAMQGLEWQHRITGVPGVVARGIRRITPEPGEPPLPGVIPELVPLFDDQGAPLPVDKHPVWRADRSGELPFLIWIDDVSKDQLDGYVHALGVIWDVIASDPTIGPGLKDRLRETARAIGVHLLDRVDVGAEEPLDLVIRDADGRPTSYHDLNANLVLPFVAGKEPSSGFNAALSLGIVRTLAVVSGDARLHALYRDLVGPRGYLALLESSLADLVYFDRLTNYSNVNMMFVALYALLRYDDDPARALRIRDVLERQAYAPQRPRAPKGLKQSYFDFIYAGFKRGGVDADGALAIANGLETLGEHPSPPYWNVDVENCDAAEIDARSCRGHDGTELGSAEARGLGGALVTELPVPMRLRPSNNFLWRSDPHSPNGSASTRLNPGGDFHAAYWMGRFLARDTVELPNLRPRDPRAEEIEACGCRTSRRSGSPIVLAILLIAWTAVRRR